MQLPDTYRCAYLVGRQEIELRRVPLPSPGRGEILLRIDAATTCGTDVKVYRLGGHPRMLRVPSPFGHEMAGTVVSTGDEVTDWQPGDRVVVVNSASCGRCGFCRENRENLCSELLYLNGAFAEFLLVPRRFVARSTYGIPNGLAAAEAALVEPLACVLHGLEACQLDKPVGALVLGAGPIGQLLVGALTSHGHRVTVIDANQQRREVARRMGAEGVLDRQEGHEVAADFALTVDASGTLGGWQRALETARPGGQVLFFGGCPPGSRLELDTGRVHYDELTLRGAYHHRPAAVGRALELLSRRRLPFHELLTSEAPLPGIHAALERMRQRRDLKVVVRPGGL